MAFQPIVDIDQESVFAYEALVRGVNGEGAGQVLSLVNDSNRYRFDQSCRVKAVKLASELGIRQKLSINFLPNAIYKPESCIRTTIAACKTYDFDVENIIFEVTEVEEISDKAHLQNIFTHYKERGFLTAIDDFGSGYAGLGLLAEFQPQLIKLDMELIRNIDQSKSRQSIVSGVIHTCLDMGIDVIGEGIETREELDVLRDKGISKFQGYYFARPAIEQLPTVNFIS
ncbi:EAL domain-containing protein (putative c-di-GMP-specific phosphodiesterase class I) [Methylohalomonas lacus]|uniref:EAL domain-containing protein (Putative c-di-GMP-specific phosphodiesterase class I) n=1 Tax=Methylohalomonas lacus TaxID=398773 RepID=A0AAE3L0P0_9GAMM|nr:EAL domain-containing protein [Methylohalomonas lacus]MCS3902859.1 EAL domain-containing protein (putative c-di-GMP-specific phosphodiesterase class I) [Methylohalomonas lacus]